MRNIVSCTIEYLEKEWDIMEIKELRQIGFRYVRIRLDGQTNRYINVDFTKLLNYIGEYYPMNNRNPIGCAYTIIRKETDKLLHVYGIFNRDLKTSKREVSSIRMAKYWIAEKKNSHYYIRIPYKISFIFAAIINIIGELSKEYPIPKDLDHCVNQAYGLSFYKFYITEYDRLYKKNFKTDATQSGEKSNPAKLYDEFHSTANVFQHLFP